MGMVARRRQRRKGEGERSRNGLAKIHRRRRTVLHGFRRLSDASEPIGLRKFRINGVPSDIKAP